MTYVAHGRCRSGQRWFWYAALLDYDYPRCDDPVCEPGLHPHEYGWEDTEDLALKAMAGTVGRLGGEVRRGAYKNNSPGSARAAASALKRINAAKRRARSPKPGAAQAAPVEYLYEPWSWTDYDNYPYETHEGINEIPIVKKTARRIYYDSTSRWDRHDGVVTLGYIDRQDFETDTRCGDICARLIPAGLVCVPHGRDFIHCVHFGQDWRDQNPRCTGRGRGGCGEACPVDSPGMRCALHRFAWEHCPHGDRPGNCRHASAAGVARLPYSSEHHGGGTVYATREAAEEYLYAWERKRERKRKEHEPELKRLRTAMVKAHPDVGGSHEAFLEARAAYERALRQAS